MRDLFDDIFVNQPLDPAEVARHGMRPPRRPRFYRRVEVEQRDGKFGVVLDRRPVRTPGRHALAAPRLALAHALAAEWEQQHEFIDPMAMPLTRLANSIIDGVATAPAGVAVDIERFLACDLILYRAEAPQGLVVRQAVAWDPVLNWAATSLGAHFVPAVRLAYVTQPAEALAAARAAIPRDPWRLGALHAVTTLTGSAMIALALADGALSLDAAWAAAHVDEDWNIERWGEDQWALERRRYRFAEMQAAALVLERTGDPSGDE
jgi:chaperone required for assembly of F1-ATPase